MQKAIKTTMIFTKRPDGALCGFVTRKENGYYVSVMEDAECKKTICMPGRQVQSRLKAGVPYDVELIRMIGKNGRVVISAKPHRFEPDFLTVMLPDLHLVEMHVGCRTLTYKPGDNKSAFIKKIKKDENIGNKPLAIARFLKNACKMRESMQVIQQ